MAQKVWDGEGEVVQGTNATADHGSQDRGSLPTWAQSLGRWETTWWFWRR